MHGQVAAISVGICDGVPVLDLDYAEDSQAETDMNVVMNNGGGFIEVQGTAEGHAFRRHELDALLNLAAEGIGSLFALQAQATPGTVKPVVLASSNAGKLRELAAVLAPLHLELLTQDSLGIPAAAETGSTFLDNALLKARHAAGRAGLPALADDSGLEVDALGGAPGVWSARFAGTGASDAANLARLLQELAARPGQARSARYQCVIVFVRSAADPVPLVARGNWEGTIIDQPRGSGGFGYDPVFVPAGSAQTAAELAADEKNLVSHRGQALRALIAMLRAPGYIATP